MVQQGREELERLRGELEDSGLQEVGAKLRHKDSKLQQEAVLQSIQRELEEMSHRAEMAEATLGSERTAFGVAKESFESDLNQTLTAKDAAEACVQQIIDQCQREMKVFKFKKI